MTEINQEKLEASHKKVIDDEIEEVRLSRIKNKHMLEFKKYRRKSFSEMTPWTKEMSMQYVSISSEDTKNGSPKDGDMIARNPKNHSDMWLVAKVYFEDNLELIK